MSGKKVSMMPKGGAAVAVGVGAAAVLGAVFYSHYAQVRDKAVMKAGVERDRERLKILREQRRLGRQQQKEEAS